MKTKITKTLLILSSFISVLVILYVTYSFDISKRIEMKYAIKFKDDLILRRLFIEQEPEEKACVIDYLFEQRQIDNSMIVYFKITSQDKYLPVRIATAKALRKCFLKAEVAKLLLTLLNDKDLPVAIEAHNSLVVLTKKNINLEVHSLASLLAAKQYWENWYKEVYGLSQVEKE